MISKILQTFQMKIKILALQRDIKVNLHETVVLHLQKADHLLQEDVPVPHLLDITAVLHRLVIVDLLLQDFVEVLHQDSGQNVIDLKLVHYMLEIYQGDSRIRMYWIILINLVK